MRREKLASGLLVFAAFPYVWALFVGAALIGTGAAFNYPALMALTVNRVHEDERALAVSSFTMFFEIGSAVAGITIGLFAQIVGKRYGFVGGAAFCALGLWILRFRLLPRRTGPARRPAEAADRDVRFPLV